MNEVWTEVTGESCARNRDSRAATRRWRNRLFVGLLSGIGASTGYAQVIERLADIETGPGPQVSSFPGGFGTDAEFGVLGDGRVLFAASDPEHGRELWLSTGASAVLVRDISPGSSGSNPSGLVAFDGRVWFRAGDPAHGFELWVSDGSPAGTRRVTDLLPGGESSSATPIAALTAPQMLIFSANDAQGAGIFSITANTATPTRLAPLSFCGLFGLPGSRVSTGNRVFSAGRTPPMAASPMSATARRRVRRRLEISRPAPLRAHLRGTRRSTAASTSPRPMPPQGANCGSATARPPVRAWCPISPRGLHPAIRAG